MPSISFDHDAAARRERRIFPQPPLDLFQHAGFRLLPLAVQSIELSG
jgi:hypothetical protein